MKGNFSLSDSDFERMAKSLAHEIECGCLTLEEAAHNYALIQQFEGLTEPNKGLMHLEDSWNMPASEWDKEL